LVAETIRTVPGRPLEILLLEVSVVIIEWLLLCYALPGRRKSSLLVLSLAMNSVSYLAGLAWTRYLG
jgi:hypothetical protein